MKRYRSAIIGCGPRAVGHAQAYKLIDRGKVVACCDLDAQRRDEFAQQFDIAGYADAAEMLEQQKPDLVHVVTPPKVRVELMQLISDYGIPAAIVEKPIAIEVPDWQKLCELEEATTTRFAVCHQARWHPYLTRCRQALASGQLGELLFLDFSAGMNISGQGTHMLDWAMSLNEDSPVVRVFGAASGAQEMSTAHPGPDATIAQVVFANGVYGMWNGGLTAPRVGDEDAADVVWKHCRIAAYAERGRTLFEEFNKWEIVSPDGVEGGQTDMEQWEENNHASQAALTNAMFDWIEDDCKPAATNLKKALHQWQAVLGLYASALLRQPVDIPFDPPVDLFQRLQAALS